MAFGVHRPRGAAVTGRTTETERISRDLAWSQAMDRANRIHHEAFMCAGFGVPWAGQEHRARLAAADSAYSSCLSDAHAEIFGHDAAGRIPDLDEVRP
jgi:hypothetical protein